MISYLRYMFINPELSWGLLKKFDGKILDAAEGVVIVFLTLSMLISATSVVPILSKSSVRIECFLSIGKWLSILPESPNVQNIIYFMDVASHDNFEDFFNNVTETLSIKNSLGAQEISKQIWIVSRICAVKYIQYYLSLASFMFALIIALLS